MDGPVPVYIHMVDTVYTNQYMDNQELCFD